MKTIDFARCALALLLAAPLAAQTEEAQTAAAETPPAAVYEDVLFVEDSLPYVPDSNTVATKLPLPLQETPASVGVVTGWLIGEQGSTVLGEALQNVSGVNVQTQSGVADFFVVRGFDSIANGLVMVDGAAEPEISFYQLYNVERVEVLKGPGGFLYGGNPIAATINMVRRQPEPASFLSLGIEAGSFGTHGGNFDWNLPGEGGGHDSLGFRLNGIWRESDGWRDMPSEVQAVNPGFTWRPDEASALHVNLEFLDTSFAPDSGLPILSGFFTPSGSPEVASVPRERSYQSPYDFSDQETRRAQIDYERQLSPNVTLRDKAYYRRLDWDTASAIFNGVLPGAAGLNVSRSLVLLDDRQEFLGNQLEAVIAAKTGNVTHQILAGFEAARLDDVFTLDVGFLPDIDLNNPVETAQGPVFLIPGQSQAGDTRSLVISPYVTDQISLSERFQVLVGARFDSIDYEDDATATERSFSQVSPLLGLTWAPAQSFSLYANAGRGFAPPSSRVVGEREPEESRQTEAGIKASLWGGKAQTTLAVYELERENIAIPDRTGITRQTGTQRSRGIELELAAEPLPRLRTFFSYAYTDAELTRFAEIVLVGFNPLPVFATIDRSGNTPAFAPEHIANLWVSRRFANGIGAGVGGRYLSEQLIAEDNAFELDATFTLNAALFYELNDWSLGLHFENLTDEEYFTRGFGSTSVIPASGTTVHGTLAYRFGH